MAALVTLLVEAAIVITTVEAVALVAYHRVTGRGMALHAFGLNLLSGLMLMAALRAALTDSAAYWPIGFLAASGIAHGADMWLRWRSHQTP